MGHGAIYRMLLFLKDKVAKCACEKNIDKPAFSSMVNENPSDSVSGLVCAILHRDSSAYFLISPRFNRMCLDVSISKKNRYWLVLISVCFLSVLSPAFSVSFS